MIVTPFRAIAVGLLTLFAVQFVVPTTGRGQPPAGAAANSPSDYRPVFESCYNCHNLGPNARQEAAGVGKFLTLKESKVWDTQDLHAKAVESLKGELGQQMGKLLFNDKDVTKQPACLACHAVDLSLGGARSPEGHGAALTDFYRANGVSCEACHGLAQIGGKKLEWVDAHQELSWRSKPLSEKKGLVDLRDPTVRAERCVACHVGNAAEGKFVTHAMYAAGHPPLPPFETLTYGRDQLAHSKAPRDNEYINSLSEDDARKLFHYRKGESAPARQAAVGAAVGFGAAMTTLADAAEDAAKKGQMLDFAYFDCGACHHDLVVPSSRQGGPGTPGRPRPRTGPTALLRSVAGGDAGAFDGKLAGLVKAFDAKPFGDPATIVPTARELAGWADGLAKNLDSAPYDGARTVQLRQRIADTASRPYPSGRGLDYDDAQQLLWAFDGLRDEASPVSPSVVAALTELAGPADSPAMMLGRLYDPNSPDRPLIVKLLPGRLQKVAQYRPDKFSEAFKRILDDLGPAGR
jgi:Cytochrome c554 and c-prime